MSVQTLLDFIAKPESGGDYNIVWGGIKRAHRPKKKLVEMTVREVLAWQDSIDPFYMSEAAGKYQIMEDTLRGLYAEAGVGLDELFNPANQDKLAAQLLRRRGLKKYLAGQISDEAFANNLAHEWASLPMVTGPKKGRSVYSGDGLNKSHVSVAAFLAAVRGVKYNSSVIATEPSRAPGTPSPQEVSTGRAGFLAWLSALLASFFRGK